MVVTPTEENREAWEIDGRPVPLVELMGERDAIELSTKPMAPIEMPADTNYRTRQAEEQPESAAISLRNPAGPDITPENAST